MPIRNSSRSSILVIVALAPSPCIHAKKAVRAKSYLRGRWFPTSSAQCASRQHKHVAWVRVCVAWHGLIGPSRGSQRCARVRGSLRVFAAGFRATTLRVGVLGIAVRACMRISRGYPRPLARRTVLQLDRRLHSTAVTAFFTALPMCLKARGTVSLLVCDLISV